MYGLYGKVFAGASQVTLPVQNNSSFPFVGKFSVQFFSGHIEKEFHDDETIQSYEQLIGMLKKAFWCADDEKVELIWHCSFFRQEWPVKNLNQFRTFGNHLHTAHGDGRFFFYPDYKTCVPIDPNNLPPPSGPFTVRFNGISKEVVDSEKIKNSTDLINEVKDQFGLDRDSKVRLWCGGWYLEENNHRRFCDFRTQKHREFLLTDK